MFKRFLAIKNTPSDDREKSKDTSFIDLVVLLEKSLKRSLRQPELSTVWSLDDVQTEVITNLLKEVRDGEKRGT
jgi:hypothetical protein